MNEKIQEYLSDAGIAFVGGQYDTALEFCEKAIAEDPTNADAYTGAGKACLVLNRLEEAEGYSQKAVEYDSANGERYFDLGNIKFGLEQFPDALMNYAKAEQLGCNDIVRQKLYYQIGILNHISGDTQAALMNFEKADSFGVVNEDTKEMLVKRLQIYIEMQDFDRAENYAVQLKMLAPDEFRSYQIYFQVLMAIGKYDQAEALLVEAEKYSDIDADILNIADMYFNRAMIFAVKAEVEPENASVHYDSAIAIFDEFLATPDLPQEVIVNTNIAKAEIYLKLEKYDDALGCVEGLVIEDEPVDAPDTDDGIDTVDDTGEKIDFIKLTCYLGKEDYDTAADFAGSLKLSENEQYSYFATYADAFIAQKFADKDPAQKEIAEEKYNIAIAFFKHKAFENPLDLFAIIFRTRLYAENGKYTMAEELIKLLPDEIKTDLNKYVSDCRAEREGGD